MIPKKIHYCWFGKKPFSDSVGKCIESWKKYCPDYEIIEWNEENFDVNENKYCHEAYNAKKWAFVADYVRVKVLFDHGGIYMDTDVEVVRSYDALLKNKLFCCFEDNNNVSIGTLGVEKGNELLRILLDYYNKRSFVKQSGKLDMTTNVKIVTDILVNRYGLLKNGRFQILGNGINIYPQEYFIAKNYRTGDYNITKETYAIHHYNGSWMNADDKIYRMKYIEIWNKMLWIKNKKIRHIISAVASVLLCKNFKILLKIFN